jgi:hypothetical protein
MIVALVGVAGAASAQVPELLAPEEGAVMDNGRTDRQDAIVWDFDWTDCEGATQYHLYVKGANALYPVIDDVLTQSSYRMVSQGSYIIESNRFGWVWQVRAQVNGSWGDWSPERTFDVEPLNTDPPTVFWDVTPEHWAYDQINSCASAGLVQGYWDGSYRPDLPVTREQMAVYIARGLAGSDAAVQIPAGVTEPTFNDVGTGHWAYRYIEYCVGAGIIEGYPDGSYRPNAVVDRGQMAVYIARADAGGDGAVPLDTDGATFTDVTDNNDWAWCCRHVEYCAAHGIVQGYLDGTYHPEREVTRDQMAVYVARAFVLPL